MFYDFLAPKIRLSKFGVPDSAGISGNGIKPRGNGRKSVQLTQTEYKMPSDEICFEAPEINMASE